MPSPRAWSVVTSVACLHLLAHSPAGAQEPPAPPPPEVAPPPPEPPPPPPKPKPTVAVSGYTHLQLNAFVDGNDDDATASSTVLVRRLRVRFKGEVLPGLGYVVMIDASTPSNLLRDGMITLTMVPHHEIRIGQQKTQFGYENPESSTKLYTVNRAFVSDALGRGSDLRDLGIGLLGSWAVGSGLGVEYQLTLVNGSGPNVTQDATDRKNFWGRAGFSYSQGGFTVRVGGSYANGDHVRKATIPGGMDVVYDFDRIGADLEVTTPWVFLATEYVRGTNELPGGDIDAQGFYATLVGTTPWNLGPIVRYEQYDPNTDADDDLQRRYTFGAYYDVRPVNVRIIANFELDDSGVARDHAFVLWGQVIFP